MKKIGVFIGVIITFIMSVMINVYAQNTERIWMAGDEAFQDYDDDDYIEGQIGDLTFTNGVVMMSSVKMYKGDKLTRFFKLPNFGSTAAGSIKFDVEGDSDIYIIGNSNSNGEARDVVLYSTAEKKELYATINGPEGYKIEYRGGAGSIYLYAKKMPVRVYGIAVRKYPYSESFTSDGCLSTAIEAYGSDRSFTSDKAISNIKIYAAEGKSVSIVNSFVRNVYGQSYVRSVDLEGSGTSTYRTLGVPVAAGKDIYITARSNSSDPRELIVTNKYYETICDNITVTNELVTYKIEYNGSGDEIMFRSLDGGIRIYQIEQDQRNSLICYDKEWNITSNNNFSVQTITDSTIDGLRIVSGDRMNTEIIEENAGHFSKAIKLCSHLYNNQGKLIFNMPNSNGSDNTKKPRTISVYAKAASAKMTLVLANEYGLVYGSSPMETSLKGYTFDYNGSGEKLILYATTYQNTSSVNIYELSTSEWTNYIKPAARTISVTNGQTYPIYFMVSDNPQTDKYTYTISYDNSKLSVLEIGLTDGINYYGSNDIDILYKTGGTIKFKINRTDINWSGILNVVSFKAKAGGDALISFSADIDV